MHAGPLRDVLELLVGLKACLRRILAGTTNYPQAGQLSILGSSWIAGMPALVIQAQIWCLYAGVM